MSKFNKVAVLYGGTSCEREVSLVSGRGVLEALQSKGVDAFGVDLQANYLEQLLSLKCDAVFNVLHSGVGENGEVQAVLNALNLPYPGSGPAACALAMDKWRSKLVWQSLGLPVLPGVFLHPEKNLAEQVESLAYPMCVKPSHEGSTLGITKAETPEELVTSYDEALKYDAEVYVEPWVTGREFTVAMFSQELPVLELVTPNGFYDYEAKYHADSTQFLCPCKITEQENADMQRYARLAFDALGCEGWGRVDFMQDAQGDFWILEVNTVPGMTPRSDVPIMAQAVGISYPELVFQILESARVRSRSVIPA